MQLNNYLNGYDRSSVILLDINQFLLFNNTLP